MKQLRKPWRLVTRNPEKFLETLQRICMMTQQQGLLLVSFIIYIHLKYVSIRIIFFFRVRSQDPQLCQKVAEEEKEGSF
jgi:hypothetical protein